MALAHFLFILVVPVATVVGGLASLFAVGALFDALDHPGDVQQRLQTLLHPPLATAKAVGAGHYYRPYWAP